MALSQEQIVQKMIDAGEDEDNIATVIRSFKTQPQINEPEPIVNKPIAEPEFTGTTQFMPGSPNYEAPAEDTNASIKAVSPNEPDTYWGGFFKGLKEYAIGTPEERSKAFTSENPYLQGAAHPQTTGDMLSLVLPAELPNIAKGNLSKIAGSITEEKAPTRTAVTRITDVDLPIASDKPDTWFAKGHLDDAKASELNDMYKSGKGKVHRGDIEGDIDFNATDEFGNAIGSVKTEGLKYTPKEKPRYRMDRETGAGIPIDQAGIQTGPAQFPGKELVPEIAELSKYNQTAKMANESQKKSLWRETRDANRAILTAYDLSAPGRQGKALMLTKAYWTSFDDMFKSWGSQRAYDNVMESVNQHPNFQQVKDSVSGKMMPSLAERAGLNVGGKEEVLNSNIAEKYLPGVKQSERAYSAFLTKLRADHFNTMLNDAREMGMNPDKNDVVLKQLGSFINDATGRGSLGKLEKAAPILNELFFAPKLMASRVNMYKRWLNPMTYGSANPVVRQQALKSLLSTVGFGAAVGELARLGGAQVSNDPTSSDFRKVKIGNTRIDPYSGFQQYAVGATRILTGESTSSTSGKTTDLTAGRFGQQTRAKVASQFFQNKLAPVPSLIWSWMEGKDWDGKPFELKKAMLDRTVPIVMQDLADLYKADPKSFPPGIFKENPTATKIGMAALPIMGEGIQTYGR